MTTSTSNLEFEPDHHTRPSGCLYIFYEKIYRDQNKPIYKIGYTYRNSRDRLRDYPSDTQIIYEHYLNLTVPELLKIETEIKREFKQKFKPCLPSTERFEGDVEHMKKEMILLISNLTKDKNTSYPDPNPDDYLYYRAPGRKKPKSDFAIEKENARFEELGKLTRQYSDAECDEWDKWYYDRIFNNPYRTKTKIDPLLKSLFT